MEVEHQNITSLSQLSLEDMNALKGVIGFNNKKYLNRLFSLGPGKDWNLAQPLDNEQVSDLMVSLNLLKREKKK